MEVERLTAVLEASGLSTFNAQMAAADRATGGTKDQLRALAEVSKIATEALSRVKMTAAQAVESKASAESILSGVKGIGEEARQAARDLDRVKLGQAQAAETRIAADEQVRSLKQVEHQAIKTRAAVGGGGSGGGGRGLGIGLLGAGIGLAGLATPAIGPGALGLLATLPAGISGGVGTLGTLMLAFDGVTKAIGGNKKAFDDLQPAAQSFVLTVRSLDGWFDKLRQTAGAGLFPGLTAGLKAALSPGTVQQITTAVSEFGRAIGEAGAAWGRYFGSSQFQMILGPLMAAGAQNLGKMSDAAMHLFDALGVLGRAAIPLVNWMTSGADAASKWIDNFTRAKDASGGLSHAMGEAKTSLKLVGGLVAELAKVVYDLGSALYPVSKVALRDLVGGLSALDGWLKRNKQTISEVAGVIVRDFVAGIAEAVHFVGKFYDSMKQDLGSNGARGVVIALGAAIAIAFGGWPAIIAASAVAVGAIVRNWTTIKDFFKTLGQWILNAFDYVWVELQRGALKAALAVVEPFSHLPSFLGGWARKAKDSMQSELDKLKPPNMSWGEAAYQAGVASGYSWMAGFSSQTGSMASDATDAHRQRAGAGAGGGAGATGGSGRMSVKQIYSLLINAGFSPADASNFVGIAQAESGYNYRALNNNPKTGDYSVGLFQENFFKSLGPARTARYAPMFGLNPNMAPTQFVTWLQSHPAAQAQIAYDLFSSSGYGPWKGDAFVSAHPGLLSQTGTNVYGPPPPFTSGLGPKHTASHRVALQNKLAAINEQIVKATPIFSAEGPQLYNAAYGHNRQFAKHSSTNYQTKLTAQQETEFRAWVTKNHVPFDPNATNVDYDMRGYWLALQNGKVAKWAGGAAHFPDTFKTPYDTTFSHESMYATKNNPFVWKGNNLVDTRTGQLVYGQSENLKKLENEAAAIRKKLGGGNPAQLPASLTTAVSHYKTLAQTLSNTGPQAKLYLERELVALQQEQAYLTGELRTASAKGKEEIKKALGHVSDNITTVAAKIAHAIVITGDALLPEKLKTKLAKLTAKGTADADYAAVLTGQTADDYQKTIRKNLLSQAAVIQAEVTSLKSKLANASGKQKTAIQAELTKVQSSLQSVQQSILSNLQQTVQTLQGKVATAFSAVQASLVTQLGAQYFQNGALTPLEQQLKSMQDADQLGSLKDALQSAKDQQSKDQNTLSSVVYDMTTGRTTYNYSSAAQQQLAADQKAIDAAQRQLDEYNLSIKAAQERQTADQTYAKQLDKLNKQLGPLSDAFQNGTGSISALKEIAKSFGLQISDVNTPDLNDLSTASDGLKQAFKDLADYIAKITGATPKIPTTPNSVAALNSQALTAAQASGNVTDIIQAARDAGYTQSIGYLRRAGLIPMADGGSGTVTKPTLFLAGEAGREDFAFSGGGRSFARQGGGEPSVVVNLSVPTLDPGSVDWAPIMEKIRAEMLRAMKRNGGTIGIK